MKKFFIRVFVIIIIVLGFDFVFGKIMDRMLPNTGVIEPIGKTYYAINKIEKPILVIGSSRASHHYNTKMLSDSLKKEVYNLGLDGCFFLHNNAVINSILDRYTPELIIWEISPTYLLSSAKDDLSDLYPYYGKHPYITNLIDDNLKWSERIELNSNFYKYNSKVQKLLYCYFYKNEQNDSFAGYRPLAKTKLKTFSTLSSEDNIFEILSQKKIDILIKTINKIKERGSRLVLVDSPVYLERTNKIALTRLCEIADSLEVSFIDNNQNKLFLEHGDYFKDKTHLNDLGAKVYTKIFINNLMSLELYRK